MPQKENLNDCTFTIPFRAETQDRIDNITTTINYLLHHFKTNIIIYETGKESILKYFWQSAWNKSCRLFHHKEDKNIFHKTLLLNKAAKIATTPIIVSQDADVILNPDQYIYARNNIKKGKIHFCYPFNDLIVQIGIEEAKKLPKKRYKIHNLSFIIPKWPKPETSALSPGGCLFMNKKKYIEIGMENEEFINYGFEDAERKVRIQTLGYKIKYISGGIYHLQHGKTNTSSQYHPYHKHNRKLFVEMRYYNKEQMQDYVNNVLKK